MSLHSRRPVTPPSDPLDIRWPPVELTISAYNQQNNLEYTWPLWQSQAQNQSNNYIFGGVSKVQNETGRIKLFSGTRRRSCN